MFSRARMSLLRTFMSVFGAHGSFERAFRNVLGAVLGPIIIALRVFRELSRSYVRVFWEFLGSFSKAVSFMEAS